MDEGARGRPAEWTGPRLDLVLAGVAVVAGGVLAAYAVPNFVGMGLHGKRVEAYQDVLGLRTAELAYRAAMDTFVAMEPSPRATPDKQLADWVPNAGSEALGWKPDGAVRGIYWVELDADGADFTVHGRCDVDGDGRVAEYVIRATDAKPRLVTAPNVY